MRDSMYSKDRMVPIGQRALAWIDKYQREARSHLLTNPNDPTLFISRWGEGMTPGTITIMARRYVKASGIGKRGSAHVFRHTCATLMLEGGADVRYVQEMLGHASLESTAIYTYVAIKALKEVHERTHPGVRLAPSKPRHPRS